jgi:hypothetical protein
MNTLLKFCISLLAGTMSLIAQPAPVGRWTFDDVANLLKAESGNDLVLVGTQQIATGPKPGDGAMNISTGSYYRCFHTIAANGGGTMVNEFSIVIDFRIASLNKWYCFFQTNPQNSNDGDCFINPGGSIGVTATGYSTQTIAANNWYRLVVSVKLGQFYNYFLDGSLLLQGASQDVDGRFSLYPKDNGNELLFFADNDGEDGPIDVAQVMIFDRGLTPEEAALLGGYNHVPVQPFSMDLVPFLQTPTDSSVYVCWHHPSSQTPRVEFGTTPDMPNTVSGSGAQLDPNTRWQSVQLRGLVPETDYYYRCISDTARSAIYRFRSAPARNKSSGHIRFLIVGDSQTNAEVSDSICRSMKRILTERYGADYFTQVQLLMHNGDIVGDGTVLSEYRDEFFKPFRHLSPQIPIMTVRGNHEGEAQYLYDYMQYEDFKEPEGEKYYHFRIGPLLFISMNTNVYGDLQNVWLGNLVRDAERDDGVQFIFSFQHKPGHSELWPDGNAAWVENNTNLILQNSSKSVLNSHGHSHCYERGALIEGNTYLMLSGGGGGDLDRWGMYANQRDYPEIQKSLDQYCWSLVDVNLDSARVNVWTYTLGNLSLPKDVQIADRFGYVKSAAPLPKPVGLKPEGNDSFAPYQSSIAAPYDSLMCVQLQISADDSSFTSLVADTLLCTENYYLDTGSPSYQPINQNAAANLLNFRISGTTFFRLIPQEYYLWRVRFRNISLKWSEWSTPVRFRQQQPDDVASAPSSQFNLSVSPNPFSGRQQIAYELPAASIVRLALFDVTGKECGVLFSGFQSPGKHLLSHDGSLLEAEHLYFLRMECTNAGSTTQRITRIMKAATPVR